MLKKNYRLVGHSLGAKRKVEDALFILRISNNKQKDSRFGFIVSKSIDKRAVVRNRVKRVFRSLIEERIAGIKPGKDFSFIIKRKAIEADRNELSRSLISVLRKEEVLNEKTNS